MATKLCKTRICALLAIVGLSVFSTQSTVTAQAIPNANWGQVDSPGSVLHGRTVAVADELLRSLELGGTIKSPTQRNFTASHR